MEPLEEVNSDDEREADPSFLEDIEEEEEVPV
jgi:hypothetical protein